ncbi:chlorophyll(ide) b reductase NOL, chloroplastic isoform X3 [Ziziphus jujuba]|uniref:Chlorophyll(Ide) b reductase NOL, chloroplastic isoform X3 n=1 Tax=Ziziphus jujuba TaxID=326968 RepID=A0ABM4AGR4_ZIZJJ|nr:chlorophyll(ide) b reductase NOL, chloroplastic isoform X3 [Ziziphus jujuba]
MATTCASLLHLPSPSFFPLLSSKTSHFLHSPLSQQYPYSHSLYHSTFPTVSFSQTPPHHLMSKYGKWVFNSLTVRSESKPSINREPMLPPYNVLITGSTKGIGYALAKEFLKAGDNVVICSRSDGVESAVQQLRQEFGEQHVWGTQCDVREGQDVKDLVAFAQRSLGYIDIWVLIRFNYILLHLENMQINNAGSNAYSYKPLAEASDEDLIEVVATNSLGLMICCREAIKMMLNQPRGGHIFNIDGAGSDGRPTPRFAAYGATKRSVVHLTKSLQSSLIFHRQNCGCKMSKMLPGMVTTDLLMSGATTKQAKFFINVLAEPAEVVAEYLVPNIRSILANGSTKPTYIRFLTGLKAYTQIFSRIAFGARRNRYVPED